MGGPMWLIALIPSGVGQKGHFTMRDLPPEAAIARILSREDDSQQRADEANSKEKWLTVGLSGSAFMGFYEARVQDEGVSLEEYLKRRGNQGWDVRAGDYEFTGCTITMKHLPAKHGETMGTDLVFAKVPRGPTISLESGNQIRRRHYARDFTDPDLVAWKMSLPRHPRP